MAAITAVGMRAGMPCRSRCNLPAISRRVANKLTVTRLVTLAGAIAATGLVAVPAGACARMAAPFKIAVDAVLLNYSTTL